MPGCGALRGQQIRIFSEFQRIDPFGNVAEPDRGLGPREILSPAMARNGHLSVHVAVTVPAGTNYLLYAAANPADIVKLTVYREYFQPCGGDFCPDWIVEQPTPAFGAMPESIYEMQGQTTRCYLLDIWATPDTPPRRVRVEALLKVGTWLVAPMEIRVMAPTVPENAMTMESLTAPFDGPSSATAEFQLARWLSGQPPVLPLRILRLSDIEQRNAAEDMLLASSIRPSIPDLNLLSWHSALWPGNLWGAEWYLRIRDFLYNFAP